MSSSADGNATDYGNYNPTMQAIHARISKETMEEIKDMCTKHGWTLNPMSVNILDQRILSNSTAEDDCGGQEGPLKAVRLVDEPR